MGSTHHQTYWICPYYVDIRMDVGHGTAIHFLIFPEQDPLRGRQPPPADDVY